MQLDARAIFFILLHGSHLLFQAVYTYCHLAWQRSWRIQLQLLTRRLAWVMVKKSPYCSNPLLHKVELTAFWCLGLCPFNKTLFTVSPIVWVKVPPFADDDHRCSLSHTSCLHSMRPSCGDGANLARSSRERFGVLLRSLRGNMFGGHGFLEGRKCCLDLEVLIL